MLYWRIAEAVADASPALALHAAPAALDDTLRSAVSTPSCNFDDIGTRNKRGPSRECGRAGHAAVRRDIISISSCEFARRRLCSSSRGDAWEEAGGMK